MAIWKVLRGIHSDKTAKPVSLVEVKGITRAEGIFYPGDIIESDKDLAKHNTPADTRFEKLPEHEPISPPARGVNGLSGMTVKELRKLAADEEVILDETVVRKEEIINTIRAALDAA